MVSISSAESALKDLYLGVVTEQMNTGVNPLLNKIQKTASDVWGKNIVKLVTYGINGGVGAGSETGALPIAAGNNYKQFVLSLKNLYGTIELSDKVIRASENSAGAFVNLLNAEMEGLLKASKMNLSRMLFGDGSGKLCDTTNFSGNVDRSSFKVSTTKNLIEGMVVDVYASAAEVPTFTGWRIVEIDRSNRIVKISGTLPESCLGSGYFLTLQGSRNAELTGLGAIFNSSGSIYGLPRIGNRWLVPYMQNSSGAISIGKIQAAIDYVEDMAGSSINYIATAYDVRRLYLDLLSLTRTNIDYMNLDGGFKALSYNGVPVVAEKFVDDGTMFLLNTDDFKMHQLCDWRWIEGEGGRVLMQKAGTPTYTATLVKYADLI